MILQLILAVVFIIVAMVLWKVTPIIYRALTSPLRHIPGPPIDSLVFGNFIAMSKSEDCRLEESWVKTYGDSILVPGAFRVPLLLTADTRALNHVLTHTLDYQKSEESRHQLGFFIGAGVLVAEGEQHRRQRRALNPAFGPAQIRELTSIFVDKSLQLRDAWLSEISKNTGNTTRIEVLSWMNRVALDIIGLAGFGYTFDALTKSDGSANELEHAFSTIFEAEEPTFFEILQVIFVPLKLIRTAKRKRAEEAQTVMRRIGMRLIAERKAAILAEKGASDGRGTTRKDVHGRDLLTLLIKANMAFDIPDSQRLSDEEVLGQVPTFMVAGHETTSGATIWCLYALTQAPEIQQKLREELLTVETETPTMDELKALPYLDMVVKETLRFHSPVPMTHREAQKDDFIPLNEPFTDSRGKVHDHIQVSKGDVVLIAISLVNRSEALWGEDAAQFKPERWLDPPEAIRSIPGVWSDVLTFLGGPRSCIGYRFAIVEMKALLFTLVRAFEFELAVPAADVAKRTSITQRPIILSEQEKGNQMPMLIRQYTRS